MLNKLKGILKKIYVNTVYGSETVKSLIFLHLTPLFISAVCAVLSVFLGWLVTRGVVLFLFFSGFLMVLVCLWYALFYFSIFCLIIMDVILLASHFTKKLKLKQKFENWIGVTQTDRGHSL